MKRDFILIVAGCGARIDDPNITDVFKRPSTAKSLQIQYLITDTNSLRPTLIVDTSS
jgi:hypothetical protein